LVTNLRKGIEKKIEMRANSQLINFIELYEEIFDIDLYAYKLKFFDNNSKKEVTKPSQAVSSQSIPSIMLHVETPGGWSSQSYIHNTVERFIYSSNHYWSLSYNNCNTWDHFGAKELSLWELLDSFAAKLGTSSISSSSIYSPSDEFYLMSSCGGSSIVLLGKDMRMLVFSSLASCGSFSQSYSRSTRSHLF